MNRYESYRKTKIDWIGHIPEGWNLSRAKSLFRNKSQKNFPDEPLLSVTQKNGIVIRSESDMNVWNPTDDVSGYKLIEPGDFVISLRSFEGGIELSKVRGIVSPAYTVLEKQKEMEGHYFWWLMKSHQFIIELNKHVTGIRQGKNIGWNDFSNIYLTIPSSHEQKLIARYLDEKTTQIDSLITKKTRFLELIKEKILAIAMNEQIHGGGKFDRLRRLTEVISKPATIIDDDEYVALGLYNRGRGHFHKPATLGKDMGDSRFFTVEEGDLILSGQFAWEGAITMASDKETGCVVSHRYPVIRGKSIATEYLLALLMTDFGNFLLSESSRGAAGRNKPLNIKLLLNEKIRIPSLEVQNEIRRLIYFRAQAEKKFKKSTELLKEYRQSLISSVVTGKIKVTENML